MAKICGVDPGGSGAICVLDTESGTVRFWSIPSKKITKKSGKVRSGMDLTALWRVICEVRDVHKPVMVVLEEVHSMRRDGKASAFTFGYNCGAIAGLLAAAGYDNPLMVSPQRWKRKFDLLMKSDTPKAEKKAKTVAKFVELSGCPESALVPPKCRVPDDGWADSALIAIYGAVYGEKI